MTIFLHIRERFPARALEWLCSGLIFALGLAMLIFPASFDRVGLESFSQLMRPAAWAAMGVALGGMRLSALFINGRDPRVSIPARLAGAVLGAGYYGLFVGRFAEGSTSTSIAFGVVTYSALMLADIYNAMRVTADRKAQREGV